MNAFEEFICDIGDVSDSILDSVCLVLFKDICRTLGHQL